MAAFRGTSYSVKSSCLAFLEGLLAQLTRLCDGLGHASDLIDEGVLRSFCTQQKACHGSRTLIGAKPPIPAGRHLSPSIGHNNEKSPHFFRVGDNPLSLPSRLEPDTIGRHLGDRNLGSFAGPSARFNDGRFRVTTERSSEHALASSSLATGRCRRGAWVLPR